MPTFQPMKVRVPTVQENLAVQRIWYAQGAVWNSRDDREGTHSEVPFLYLDSGGGITYSLSGRSEYFEGHPHPEHHLVDGALHPVAPPPISTEVSEPMTRLPDMKVRIHDREYSIRVQRAWINSGARWSGGGSVNISNENASFLFLRGGSISWTDNENRFEQKNLPERVLSPSGHFDPVASATQANAPPCPVRPPSPRRHPLDGAIFTAGRVSEVTSGRLATATIDIRCITPGADIRHDGAMEFHGTEQTMETSEGVAIYLRDRVLSALNGEPQQPSVDLPPEQGTRARARDDKQVALLREARAALDALLKDQPLLATRLYGTSTLGALRDSLNEYK